MYKRVLVATGGSPWSEAAVTYAISLAACTGAELHILTVLTVHAAYALPDVMASSEMVMESIERQGQDLLAEASAQATHAGVVHATLCKWGNIPETILQTANEEDSDLIIIGSRIVAGRKRLLLGSISNAVTAKSRQPVLIIKQPPPTTVPGSPLWRRVLVATGGSPWSDAAVDYTLHLAQRQELEVYMLLVEPRQPQQSSDQVPGLEQNPALAQAALRADQAGVAYETRLGYGNTIEVIAETATGENCDVIILGSRGLTGWKRLMLGSTSNAVAVKTALPVLIVKRFMRV
jgi:nucleotide-binding universal stress UspA family protein